MSKFIVLLLLAVFLLASARAQTGVYTLNGGTATQTNQTYSATLSDESAVYVLNSGNLTLTNCTMMKTGDASNVNNSSQYGINAGLLANSAGKVIISGGSVTTDADGGNGLFATGNGSSITMTGGSIVASGNGAHGVDVTYGGFITLVDVDVTTTSSNSSALATDFGGGTVTVTGGTIIASDTTPNSHSAGIYSTGVISVTGASVTSMNDHGGVIDGANSIFLSNTDLTGTQHGIMLWKTAPATGSATVTIEGGSLSALDGDAFYINGTTGNPASAILSVSNGAAISASTGRIVNVVSSSTANFAADGVNLIGNFEADATSTLSVTLENGTTLTGNAQQTSIAMDAGSMWTLTANSILRALVDPDGISGLSVTNILGNGYSIHYDSSLAANQYLGGLTYSLVNGGVLTPDDISTIDDQHTLEPTKWMLYQNYPNPFNPRTTILYVLQATSQVSLKIYNSLGQQVNVLVNEKQPPGEKSVVWDGNDSFGNPVSSGIYIYQIQVDSYVESRKMILSR